MQEKRSNQRSEKEKAGPPQEPLPSREAVFKSEAPPENQTGIKPEEAEFTPGPGAGGD
ncbi:hypothetical protein D3C86_1265320 [compost metagenome]